MSLHADLSPEAIARLAAQKRKSTISSIVIALLVVVLIGLLLGFILLPALEKENPVIVTYESNYRPEDELQEKKVQTTVQRKPSAPSASMAKVITANTVADVSIPVPDVDVPVPSMDFGDGDDFGSGTTSLLLDLRDQARSDAGVLVERQSCNLGVRPDWDHAVAVFAIDRHIRL